MYIVLYIYKCKIEHLENLPKNSVQIRVDKNCICLNSSDRRQQVSVV